MNDSKTLAVIDTMQPLKNVNSLVTALDEARENLGNTLLKTADVKKHYANAMVATFGLAWYEASGETKKLVKAEHEKFISMAENKLKWTRSNIDKVWSEIKDLSGRVKAQNKVTSTLDIDETTIKELKTMLNRILGAEPESCPKSQSAKKYLLDAATALGIDTAQDLKH